MGCFTLRSLSIIFILLCLHRPNGCAQAFLPEWAQIYSHDSSRHSKPAAISLTPDGNIIVAGSSEDQLGEIDYAITKISPAGKTLWTTRYTSSWRKNSHFRDMTVDKDGNIIFTGSSDTVALDLDGRPVWAGAFPGRSIQVNSDFAYVTGLGLSPSFTAQLGNDLSPPVDIILDTDPDQDPDDMSDITMLHNLMTRGEVNILGIIGSNPGIFLGPCIQIMNGYYRRTNIPVAVPTTGASFPTIYGPYVTNRFHHFLASAPQIGEATATYRKILASRLVL